MLNSIDSIHITPKTSSFVRDTLNRPIHDLRISVIDRCNFRCPYCMPEKAISKHYSFLQERDWLTFSEIIRLVKIFIRLGVTKIRLTGGEPLLRPNLTKLIKKLSELPIEDLALTTNGSLLKKYANPLKKSGLKRLTISLDTLDSRIFKVMSGKKGNLNQILEGINTAKKCGFDDLKINVVVQRGVNDHNILDLIEYFRYSGHVLRFIEYMDVGNCNHWDQKYVVPSKEILKLIHQKYPLKPMDANYFGEVAERYQFLDGAGEIGFISSVTQPFCQDCTRIRLSTDGKIYTCLFSSQGTDLKELLRSSNSDEKLFTTIQNVWLKRTDQYSQLRSQIIQSSQPNLSPKVEMFQIGG